MRREGLQRRMTRREAGLTLVELIVAFTVLLILSTMALPMMTIRVRREKERRLREALDEVRTAIDRYKDAADQGLLGEQDPDNHGYPESLDILVEGVEVNSGGMGANGQMGMGGEMGPNGQMGMGGGMNGGIGGRSGFGNQSSFGNNRQSGFGSSRSGSGGFGSSNNSRNSRSGFGSSQSGMSGMGDEGMEDDDEPKKMRFLRRIPVDPLTGRAEWGMRSVSDSPDSMSWGGRNVFDVFSMSMDMALDGTRYSEW